MAIQVRRGTQADLIASNLLLGEPAYAIDTKRFLIGSGDSNPLLVVTQSTGEWTPTLISTSGDLNQPVSSAEGRWFKTGSVITLQINIIISSGTIHAGNIAIVNATAPADISPPSNVNAPVLVGRLMTNSNALGANSLKLPLHIGMMSNRMMFLYKPTGHLQGSDLAAGNMITITGSYSI